MEVKIFGITTGLTDRKLEDMFERQESGDNVYYVSRKTFEHREDGLNFDYKYVIEFRLIDWDEDNDGKYVCSLFMVVTPDSIHPIMLESIKNCCCADEVNSIDMIDYGCVVGFGDFICEENEIELSALKVASVYETIDSLRGFYLDKPFNAIGTPKWNIINHVVNNTPLF